MPKDNKKIIGAQTKAIPVKQKEIGIDTTKNLTTNILDAVEVSDLDINSLEGFSNVAQTREQVYALIDTMSQDDKISAILETYAEDTVEPNDAGQIVWCESSDGKVAKYVSYLLDSLNVDKNIYGWASKLIKYGDLYLKLYRESDYGDDLLFGKDKSEDGKSTLNEDVNLHISGKDDHYVHYVEAMPNPGEMFELTKFGKTMGYIKAPVTMQQNYDRSTTLNTLLKYRMKKSDVSVYDATEFVHACLEDNSSRTPEEVSIFLNDDDMKEGKESSKYTVKRGQSLLANSFKIWRELTLLENSVLLNRLTKSAIVRILNVDVGDMPKEQVNNFIMRLKEKVEQKSALNVGNSMTEYTNPGPIENIIYVPTHGTQGNISAQAIGGDVDPKQLTDLDWFNNELYGSFRIPKAYFGWTDDGAGFNGGTSLSILSARYGKAVKRIQNTLCQAITDLINLFLLDKGLTSYINKFTIRMQSPITQEELDRRENMRNKVGVVNDIMSQIGQVVTDETIKTKITKVLLADSIADPEVISLLQEQIDLMEESAKEGEDEEEKVEKRKKSPKKPNQISSTPEHEDNEPNIAELEIKEPELSGEESDETIEPIEANTNISNTSSEDSYLPSANELGLDLTDNGEF